MKQIPKMFPSVLPLDLAIKEASLDPQKEALLRERVRLLAPSVEKLINEALAKEKENLEVPPVSPTN